MVAALVGADMEEVDTVIDVVRAAMPVVQGATLHETADTDVSLEMDRETDTEGMHTLGDLETSQGRGEIGNGSKVRILT